MTREILGRAINGDVSQSYHARIEQWDEEKFLEMVDAVFDADPELTAFQWRQYTPYFNDGEPCEFGAYINDDAFAAFGGVPEWWPYESGEWDSEEEEGNIEILSLSEMQGVKTKYTYNPEGKSSIDRYTWYDEPCRKSGAYEAAKALSDNFSHFEDMLREHFGDHAKVVATREGFNVEFYEHD